MILASVKGVANDGLVLVSNLRGLNAQARGLLRYIKISSGLGHVDHYLAKTGANVESNLGAQRIHVCGA